MVRKKSKSQSKIQSKKQHYLVFAGVVALVLVLVSGIIGKIIYVHNQQTLQSSQTVSMSPETVDSRRDRIESIYDSLKLGPDYVVNSKSIFGAKRVYSYDAGRTFSSSIIYTHDANVDVTAADLRQKIEAIGFTYFDEPYPGSSQVQYHFKSAAGEYIRLSVSSKPMDDAIYSQKTPDAAYFAMDKNASPSNVTIKVNLDDNNE